jgi:hypothetical protein
MGSHARGKLGKLGQGEWLVTVALPSGRRLSHAVRTDAEGHIDTADLTAKLMSSAGEILAAMLPAIVQIGLATELLIRGICRAPQQQAGHQGTARKCSGESGADDQEQSIFFSKKAREIEADEDLSASDELLGYLIHPAKLGSAPHHATEFVPCDRLAISLSDEDGKRKWQMGVSFSVRNRSTRWQIRSNHRFH